MITNKQLNLLIKDLYSDNDFYHVEAMYVMRSLFLSKNKFQVKIVGDCKPGVKVITVAMFDRLWQKEQEKSFLVDEKDYYKNGTLNFQTPKHLGDYHFVVYFDGKVVSERRCNNTVEVRVIENNASI